MLAPDPSARPVPPRVHSAPVAHGDDIEQIFSSPSYLAFLHEGDASAGDTDPALGSHGVVPAASFHRNPQHHQSQHQHSSHIRRNPCCHCSRLMPVLGFRSDPTRAQPRGKGAALVLHVNSQPLTCPASCSVSGKCMNYLTAAITITSPLPLLAVQSRLSPSTSWTRLRR
jgi:hypothetical protein